MHRRAARRVRSAGSPSSCTDLDPRVVEAGPFGEISPQIRRDRLPDMAWSRAMRPLVGYDPGGTWSVILSGRMTSPQSSHLARRYVPKGSLHSVLAVYQQRRRLVEQ